MLKRVLATTLIVVFILFLVLMIVNAKEEADRKRAERQKIEAMARAHQELVNQDNLQAIEKEPYYPIELYVEGMFNDEYTRAEVIEIASTVCVEARGGSDKLQRAVASVVINRKNNPNYPDTIHGVIHQHGQYQGAISGTMQQYVDIYNGEEVSEEEFLMYERVFENVEYVLECGITVDEDVLYQSGFPQGSGVYDIIDGEVFCYE